MPVADVAMQRFVGDIVAENRAVFRQQSQRAVFSGGDELRSVAVNGLRGRPDGSEICNHVGDCLRRQIALQAFGHQRLAVGFKQVEIGTEQRVLLPFLFLEGDAGRSLGGQDAGVREPVDSLSGVAPVAFVESAIGVEYRLDQP